MIRLSPDRLSFHLIWIFGLLEMITVPLVVWLPDLFSVGIKSPLEGAVVGFAGIVVLFLILNRMIGYLHFSFNGDVVTGVSILPAALWNMIFLALIFGFQKVTGLWQIDSWIPRYIFAGFVSVSCAVMVTFVTYQLVYPFFAPLRISIRTAGQRYMVKKISVVRLAFLAGAYEGIALPVILLWQKADAAIPLVAVFTGLAGGMLGCTIVVLLYNHWKLLRVTIFFEKK
ncbi:MAG: hypothetical protein WCR01_01780 [Bacteroidota bacterium]